MKKISPRKGIPNHQKNEDKSLLVKTLSALGMPINYIAKKLGVNHQTVWNHYREEIEEGLCDANAKVAQALYKKALDGDRNCQIFWLRARAGWLTDREFKEPINLKPTEENGEIIYQEDIIKKLAHEFRNSPDY